MQSYARRLESMSELLRDEGARLDPRWQNTAKTLYYKRNCKTSDRLLRAGIILQEELIQSYRNLLSHAEIEDDLYDLLQEQKVELEEVNQDMESLLEEIPR